MTHQAAAAVLSESLHLDTPPVALAFAVGDSARTISTRRERAPSACSFWRDAESGVFYAPAEAHFNCPIGAMVMGFHLPREVSDELMQLVDIMGRCGYVSSDEPGRIPTYKGRTQGIIYGPLSDFPLEPDVVLCWLTPLQAMIWNEAAGGAIWSSEPSATVLGRPACAALPTALDFGRPVMSLGCMGMRTFTDIADDRLLAVVPGSNLSEFTAALQAMQRTNDAMKSFYASRKQAVAPTQ